MKFLKNKWVTVFIIIVVLVIVITVSSNPDSPINFIYKAVSVPLQPIQKFFSSAGKRISYTANYFSNYEDIEQELSDLKAENEKLKNGQVEQELQRYKEINDELNRLLEISSNNDNFNYTTANVIVYDTNSWYSLFSIDKGSSSGIKLYDTVITSNGIAGKVVEVAPASAKVMSVINEENTLMGRLSKTNHVLRIRGMDAPASEIYCKADRIDDTVDIAVGDIVETAESSGVYPRGIVIGTVKQIVTEGNSRYAIIEPATDFRKIDKVMVMTPKSADGEGE